MGGDVPLPASAPEIHGTCIYGHRRKAPQEVWVTLRIWTDWANRQVTTCGYECAIKYLLEHPT